MALACLAMTSILCGSRLIAAVAELADALGSGPSGSKIPWSFDSSQPHLALARGDIEGTQGPEAPPCRR